MTKVYFVRHAQPDYGHADDSTRPLTEEGRKDAGIVLETLRNKAIDVFYCSPYKRCLDTIRQAAEYYHMDIRTDARLRERKEGVNGNTHALFQKRWADHSWHEPGGESIEMVQHRNIEALNEILTAHNGKRIAVGTHGTALSSIINYYQPEFGCADFLRILDWMPYIIELDFEWRRFVSFSELAHIEKVFIGK